MYEYVSFKFYSIVIDNELFAFKNLLYSLVLSQVTQEDILS